MLDGHLVAPHRQPALNSLQGGAVTLHAFPAAFYIVRQLFRGHPARQFEQGRIGPPSALFIRLHQSEEFLIIVWLDNVGTNVDALVADQRS